MNPNKYQIEALSKGGYFSKQFGCQSSIIRWSHTNRFAVARKLLLPFSGGHFLDYGCGDGIFLALNHDLYKDAVGVDLSAQQISLNLEHFRELKYPIKFVTVKEFKSEDRQLFDVITCMETLEHCIENDAHEMLSLMKNKLKPEGVLLISVPIEIGPSLIVKQILRRIASWRKLSDYKYMEKYSFLELLKMFFASSKTAISRFEYQGAYGHKGFNWKDLKIQLEKEFDVTRTTYSPLPFPQGWVSSQVFFLCKIRS